RVISVPVVWPKSNGALVGRFGVGDVAHVLVYPGHAYQGVGLAWIDLESPLKFPQSEVVLAEGRVEKAHSNVHGGETIIDFHGGLAIRESLPNPRGMMIRLEFQAIRFSQSRVTQSKARVLLYGGVQCGNR